MVVEVASSELSRHSSEGDCWVAIDGSVYDVTGFLDRHPGGRAALLRHAGKDATADFWLHHSRELLEDVGAAFLVGPIEPGTGPPVAARRPLQGRGPSPGSFGPVTSPFPHARFEGSGLEAVRFHWANLAKLTMPPSSGSVASGAVFRQRNALSPLRETDWLHVAEPSKYAHEMAMRHTLLTRHAELVSTAPVAGPRADADVVAAEAELLDMVLRWLQDHHPDRFVVSEREVRTTTPGYEHTFARADFADCPMKLAALLVQEDLILMREEPIAEGGVKDFARADLASQGEDHPTGKRHVLASGISCFSTNVVKRHMLPMSAIHHPAVPGFQAQLQHAMNRFMADLTTEGHWRHNYMFQDFDSIILLDHPWAQYVCQQQLAERKHHLAANRAARFSVDGSEGFFRDVRSKRDVHEIVRLRCEYQTLRRLKQNGNFIAFTVKTYVDPLQRLAAEPSAALALSAAIRLKHKGVFYYQSMGLEEVQWAVLGYLDGLVSAAGLKPWRGWVPEPWERGCEEDGTFAAGAERQARAAAALRRRRRTLRALAISASGGLAAVAVAAWLWRGRRRLQTTA